MAVPPTDGTLGAWPRCGPTCGGAGGIEEGGLSEQDKRALGVAAVGHVVFGRRDFLEAAAEMHGGGARAVRGFPGNGAAQGVIDFENAGSVAVVRKLTGESRGETIVR